MKKIVLIMMAMLLMLSSVALAEEVTASIVLSNEGFMLSGSGVTVEKHKVLIMDGGVYNISGSTGKGRIVVEADGEPVTLILNNVTIAHKDNEVIVTKGEQPLTIILPEGTASSVSVVEEAQIKGAIRVRGDLTISGKGQLAVTTPAGSAIAADGAITIDGASVEVGSAGDGFHSKGNMAVLNASLNIRARDEGIQCGNDAKGIHGDLNIENAVITVSSMGDALRSNLGSVSVTGGSLLLISGKNAIEASESISVADAKVIALTGKKALNAPGIPSTDAQVSFDEPLPSGERLQISEAGQELLSITEMNCTVDRLTAIGVDVSDLQVTYKGESVPLN